ncbi:amino acid ABC transporter ATP-binding protein [Corynebacterium pacaense]|uniref:amino acid ABC transporter ATP-binding protein n=1 Tax=Corynebacterium pacaense TaxID=1816684 RepID=UPI0011788E46|nr:amino acid ABC transporter ATP-binding protein [Corynebacterium pacaense]
MSEPILTLESVEKIYPTGVKALKDVSLSVQRSEVIAVIGPSGCGKSTLLRTVNGLEDIQGGSITFHGDKLNVRGTKWEQVRQRIGMVFQSYELFPHLSVMGNLLLGPTVVTHRDKATARAQAEKLLTRVGLLDRADSKPHQLSGGQKQRIAIVRALMMNPEVLLLDEITASLDPEMVREVLDVVLELAREGMTMLIVTHEMGFARAIADRVVFMDAGRIVEIDTPERFFTAPSSQRAATFLDTFVFQDPGTGAP